MLESRELTNGCCVPSPLTRMQSPTKKVSSSITILSLVSSFLELAEAAFFIYPCGFNFIIELVLTTIIETCAIFQENRSRNPFRGS